MSAGLITAIVGAIIWTILHLTGRESEVKDAAKWVALVGLGAWLLGH